MSLICMRTFTIPLFGGKFLHCWVVYPVLGPIFFFCVQAYGLYALKLKAQ